MDENFQDLEAELKSLHPRTPSLDVLVRLENKLAPPASVRLPGRRIAPSMLAWARVGWAVAVAFIVFAGLMIAHRKNSTTREISDTKPQNPAPIFKPVRAGNLHYASLEEGYVLLNDGLPARRVLDRYIDSFEWRDPRTNASVEWRIPREEVRIIPVSAY